MYKAISNGTIECGKEWELTNSDRLELQRIIMDLSDKPLASRRQGIWVQRQPSDILESGFRIFGLGEELDNKDYETGTDNY